MATDYRYAYSEELKISGLSDYNSTSNGPDDGTNNKLAARFSNCKRHGSTAEAVNIFLNGFTESAASTTFIIGNINLCGHGNEGQLETGTGQTGAFEDAKMILTFNQYAWEPELSRLATGGFPVISIYSCHTGAGQDGADLLFAMATVVGRAVRARTGLTYVSDTEVSFEPNSTWQIATPTRRPAPIAAPSPHLWETDVDIVIKNKNRSEDLVLPENSIRKITICRTEASQFTLFNSTVVEGSQAVGLAKVFFHSEPFIPSGDPLAFATATVDIVFETGNNELIERQFVIYNNRLLKDILSGYFYYAQPSLHQFLLSL